jgi:hypothetical protein
VPHEWLPFWVSRREAAQQDQVLAELAGWKTVVRLRRNKPMADQKAALHVLQELPSYVLLTFRHLRTLQIVGDGSDRLIARTPKNANKGTTNVWTVADSTTREAPDWRVREAKKRVPDDLLHDLDESDRERMREVSLLVAAPVDATDSCCPRTNFQGSACTTQSVKTRRAGGHRCVPCSTQISSYPAIEGRSCR